MDPFTPLRAALAGQYDIIREVGHGGMATVYLAATSSTTATSRSRCSAPMSPNRSARQRFLREIRLAARLNHPHILPLYDSGEAGRVPVLT